MVTERELNEAIEELSAAAMKLGRLLSETGNKTVIAAYREHALKGFYHFCQECSLLFGKGLEDIE